MMRLGIEVEMQGTGVRVSLFDEGSPEGFIEESAQEVLQDYLKAGAESLVTTLRELDEKMTAEFN